MLLETLRGIFSPWVVLSDKRKFRVRDLRAQRIDDSVFQPYRHALGSTESFEEIEQEMTTGYQHGDLHGFNVLCHESEGAVVIDFGNVGRAPTCLDPVILELSVLFHMDSPFPEHLVADEEASRSVVRP